MFRDKKSQKHRTHTKTSASALAVLLLFAIAAAGWQTDFLEISDRTQLLCSMSLAHGHTVKTSYQHSVEKTEVKDIYRVADGKIWSWEECVKSSNAGMPSVLPKYMHFVNSGSGLIFRGGRIAADSFNIRSGNNIFGKNTMCIFPYRQIDLYKTVPDRRLTIKIIRKPYLFKKRYFSEKFTGGGQKPQE